MMEAVGITEVELKFCQCRINTDLLFLEENHDTAMNLNANASDEILEVLFSDIYLVIFSKIIQH